jgi:hypothetical protein
MALLFLPELGADVEEAWLRHLSRHDRKLLRQVCKAGRAQASSRTSRIGSSFQRGGAELMNVNLAMAALLGGATDLASAFPNAHILEIRSGFPTHTTTRWLHLLLSANAAFAARLRALRAKGPWDPLSPFAMGGVPAQCASDMQCLGRLTSLERLSLCAASGLPAAALAALSALTRLTALRVYVHTAEPCVGALARAVPQLQELVFKSGARYDKAPLARQDLASLAGLQRLQHLHYRGPCNWLEGAALDGLSGASGLTHLRIALHEDTSHASDHHQRLVSSVARLAPLRSLILTGLNLPRLELQPLRALSQLTQVQVWSSGSALSAGQAQLLASLPGCWRWMWGSSTARRWRSCPGARWRACGSW